MGKKKKPAKTTKKTKIVMETTTVKLDDIKVRILPPIKVKTKP